MKFPTLLIAAGLLCISVHTTAQPGPRKKVGVVLSGGGAKGMAHIGALKVIEEAGIPIDYVVGVVIVRNGEIADRFYSLVHPEPDYYLYWNTRIHGLTISTCES